jgi:hypothetical protein
MQTSAQTTTRKAVKTTGAAEVTDEDVETELTLGLGDS